jgi:hypothetical protein
MTGQTWLAEQIDTLRGLPVDTLVEIILLLIVVLVLLLLLWIAALVQRRAPRSQQIDLEPSLEVEPGLDRGRRWQRLSSSPPAITDGGETEKGVRSLALTVALLAVCFALGYVAVRYGTSDQPRHVALEQPRLYPLDTFLSGPPDEVTPFSRGLSIPKAVPPTLPPPQPTTP